MRDCGNDEPAITKVVHDRVREAVEDQPPGVAEGQRRTLREFDCRTNSAVYLIEEVAAKACTLSQRQASAGAVC